VRVHDSRNGLDDTEVQPILPGMEGQNRLLVGRVEH
jgi:hypothetical protein